MVQVYLNLNDKIGFFTRNLFNEIQTNNGKALISGIRSNQWEIKNDKLSCLPEDTYVILFFPEKSQLTLSINNFKILMDDKGINHLEFHY